MSSILPPHKWEMTTWDSLEYKFNKICVLKGIIKNISLLSIDHQVEYINGGIDDLLSTIISDAYVDIKWDYRPDLPEELKVANTTEVSQCIYDCGLFHTAFREFDVDNNIKDPLIYGFWNNPWMAFEKGDVVIVLYDPISNNEPLKNRLILIGHSDYSGSDGVDNDFNIPVTCGPEGFWKVYSEDNKFLVIRNGYIRVVDIGGTTPTNSFLGSTNLDYSISIEDYHNAKSISININPFTYLSQNPRNWFNSNISSNSNLIETSYSITGIPTKSFNKISLEFNTIYAETINEYWNGYFKNISSSPLLGVFLTREECIPNCYYEYDNGDSSITKIYPIKDNNNDIISFNIEEIPNYNNNYIGKINLSINYNEGVPVCNGLTKNHTNTKNNNITSSCDSSGIVCEIEGGASIKVLSSANISINYNEDSYNEVVYTSQGCSGSVVSSRIDSNMNELSQFNSNTVYTHTSTNGVVTVLGESSVISSSTISGTSTWVETQSNSNYNEEVLDVQVINEKLFNFLTIDLANDFVCFVQFTASLEASKVTTVIDNGPRLYNRDGGDFIMKIELKILYRGILTVVETVDVSISFLEWYREDIYGNIAYFPSIQQQTPILAPIIGYFYDPGDDTYTAYNYSNIWDFVRTGSSYEYDTLLGASNTSNIIVKGGLYITPSSLILDFTRVDDGVNFNNDDFFSAEFFYDRDPNIDSNFNRLFKSVYSNNPPGQFVLDNNDNFYTSFFSTDSKIIIYQVKRVGGFNSGSDWVLLFADGKLITKEFDINNFGPNNCGYIKI